jgi:hypothetical protein
VLGFRKSGQDLRTASLTPTPGEPKRRRWLGVAAARRATRLRSSPAIVSCCSAGEPIYEMRPGSGMTVGPGLVSARRLEPSAGLGGQSHRSSPIPSLKRRFHETPMELSFGSFRPP